MIKLHTVWMEMARKDPSITLLDFGKALSQEMEALRYVCANETINSPRDLERIKSVDPNAMTTTLANHWQDFNASVSDARTISCPRVLAEIDTLRSSFL